MQKIEYIHKDITEVSRGIIAHQVNCQSTMGAGLARQIALKWPKAKEDYIKYLSNFRDPWRALGKICISHIDGNLKIVHIFGQYSFGPYLDTYGKHTEYYALYRGLVKLSNLRQKIYIPYKMGAGLGGGDWKIIEPIINETLVNNDVSICRL